MPFPSGARARSQRFDDLDAVRDFNIQQGRACVVYAGWVLDVGAFKHPGPQSLIASNVGKDITAAFDERGHSAFAKELCERLSVGFVGAASGRGQVVGPARATMSAEESAIHDKLDRVIDVGKPLLPQVRAL